MAAVTKTNRDSRSETGKEMGGLIPFPHSAPDCDEKGPEDSPNAVVVNHKTEAILGLKYKALLTCIGDLVFHVDRNGVLLDLYCPPDHESVLSKDGLVGRRIVELLPTQIGLQAVHYLEKALRTGQPQHFSYQYNLGGRIRDFQARLCPCGKDEVTALVRDITDRRIFEKEILEVCHRTQLRIGQDLHDGLGQHLTGITFLSRALENKLTARGLPEAAEAAEIAKLVIQALAQTRNLSRGLFPVELESGGLVPALKELASTMKSLYQLSCGAECEANLIIKNRSLANHLFRLAQEAVNNAVKHGRAREIRIRLYRKKELTVLSILDDGTGFDAAQQSASGLGIRIMQYRAKKIGATLNIQAASNGGTEVLCSFQDGSEEGD